MSITEVLQYIYTCTEIPIFFSFQVNVKVQNKTGLIVATAEGYPNAVNTLLDFNASVNEQVQLALN